MAMKEHTSKQEQLLITAAEVGSALSKENNKKTIQKYLGILGTTISATTVIVFKLKKSSKSNNNTLKIQYGWCIEKVNLQEFNKVLIDLILEETLPLDFKSELIARKSYIISDNELSPVMRKAFQLDSGFNMLVVPIFFINRLWGLITLHDINTQRNWTEGERAVLEIVACSIGCSLEATKLNKELANSNRVRTEFLTNVSHEIRNPLASISAFTQLLQEEASSLSENQQDYLNEIEINTVKMLIEINTVMQLTRIESGGLILKREKINAEEEINRIINYLQPIIRQKQMNVVLQQKKVQEQDVYLDQMLLRQIITNLLNNIIKYSSLSDRITIQTECGTKEFTCWIIDSGPEICIGDRKKVFEKYYRSPQDGASSIGGTGLGLYLCKELVSLQGGKIWVEETRKGGGNKFVFTIPLKK